MNLTGNSTVVTVEEVDEYEQLFELAVQCCRARRLQREARRRAEDRRQEDERREWRRRFIQWHRSIYNNNNTG